MKKELLLSTLILSTPVAHVSTSQAARVKAEIGARLLNGQKTTYMTKKPIGLFDGKKAFLRITLEKNQLEIREPNQITPELSGIVELVFEDGTTEYGFNDEGDMVFDLVHSGSGEIKYTGYDCSSSLRCEANGRMNLSYRAHDDQLYASIQLPAYMQPLEETGSGLRWTRLNFVR